KKSRLRIMAGGLSRPVFLRRVACRKLYVLDVGSGFPLPGKSLNKVSVHLEPRFNHAACIARQPRCRHAGRAEAGQNASHVDASPARLARLVRHRAVMGVISAAIRGWIPGNRHDHGKSMTFCDGLPVFTYAARFAAIRANERSS